MRSVITVLLVLAESDDVVCTQNAIAGTFDDRLVCTHLKEVGLVPRVYGGYTGARDRRWLRDGLNVRAGRTRGAV